jgi:hypothetical protein
MARPLSWALPVVLLCLVLAGRATASVEARSEYTKSQTYNGALRYLRVDLGYEVTEKDPDAAYLLFKYVPTGQKALRAGSIEIVEHQEAVNLYVHLPDLPRYHEEMLSDGLLKKLREEYGEPPPRHDAPPPRAKDKRGKADGPDGGS